MTGEKTEESRNQMGSRAGKKIYFVLLLSLAGLLYLSTSFYTVSPNERALVRRFGKALPKLRGPGLHIGLPWGLDKVDKVKVNERKRVGVGLSMAERASGLKAEPKKAESLTGDRNLIVVPAIVTYRISDPKAYLCNVADPEGVLRAITSSTLTSIISSMAVDDVLTTRREEIAWEALKRVQQKASDLGLGLTVTWISLAEVAPPREVADAFREVTKAKEDKQRMINEANGYAERLKPLTRGEVQKILTEAQAYAEEVVTKAKGEAERFLKIAKEFASNRTLTARRLILETLERVLPRVKKVFIGEEAKESLDLQIIEEEK